MAIRHLTFFFSTTAYFVNGNKELMTDYQFYPSAERIWLCIRLYTLRCARLTKDADFGNRIIFSDEAHFDLGGYANKQNWRTENPHAYIIKPTHPKRVTIWCGFCSIGLIRSFLFENEQGAVVTVNGDRYWAMLNEFLFTKIEEEDIGNIWFQQDATQPKQHSMFCVLFLKVPLSAADDVVVQPPRSCDLTLLDSVTPTSQRRLKGYSLSHW